MTDLGEDGFGIGRRPPFVRRAEAGPYAGRYHMSDQDQVVVAPSGRHLLGWRSSIPAGTYAAFRMIATASWPTVFLEPYCMFISSAYAQAASAGADFQSQLINFAPLILIMGVMYFLLFRPQQQRVKELRQAQSSLRRGDKIVTAGGVIGQVTRVINDEEVEVQIAEGVRVRIVRGTISTVLSKSEPAKSEPAKSDASGKDVKTVDAEPVEADDAAAKKRRTPTSVK
jgi:preprotein translocase subunit YajC